MRRVRLAARLAGGVALLLSFTSSALGASFTANPSSLGAIPDGTGGGLPCTFIPGPPRDVSFNATGLTGTISDVRTNFSLALVWWVGDLDVKLIAPSGQSETIFSRTGATAAATCGDNSNAVGPYTFSDAAPASPSWWEAASGIDSFTPIPSAGYRASTPGPGGGANALISPAFTAAAPNGVWTLRFSDGIANFPGSVSGATLSIETTPPAPPTCRGRPVTITGTDGDDGEFEDLKGTPGPDVISTGAGDDIVFALAGNDVICGGAGRDELIGGRGKDIIAGEDGKDFLFGGGGADRLLGGRGSDYLKGGKGKDTLKGGAGKDREVR